MSLYTEEQKAALLDALENGQAQRGIHTHDNGDWCHPFMLDLFAIFDPNGDEIPLPKGALEELGLEAVSIDFYDEFDEDSEEFKKLEDTGSHMHWVPTSPGDGWVAIGKFDTEDGPVAQYVRKKVDDANEAPSAG